MLKKDTVKLDSTAEMQICAVCSSKYHKNNNHVCDLRIVSPAEMQICAICSSKYHKNNNHVCDLHIVSQLKRQFKCDKCKESFVELLT